MRKVSADNNRALKSRSVGVLVVAAAIAVTAVGCSVPGQGAGAAEAQLQVRAVRTEAVVKHDIGQPVEQVADVVALNVLDILPKASGEVLEVLRKRGEFVEKGDVLFRIDSRDAESAKRKSELALSSALESLQKAKDDRVNNRKDLADAVTRAEVALNNAEQDYNKMRNDFDAGKVTQHQVDQSKQQVDNARMSLESARSKLAANDNSNTIASIETQAESARISLEDATRNLDNYSVKAPASGLLTDFNVVAGQTVSMNGGKVGQVQQIDPVKIKTELSETNYQLVKNKQQLTYYSPDAPDKKRDRRHQLPGAGHERPEQDVHAGTRGAERRRRAPARRPRHGSADIGCRAASRCRSDLKHRARRVRDVRICTARRSIPEAPSQARPH